jgi:hypothetical protein
LKTDDKLQDACDRRMADANAANDPKDALFHYTNGKALFSRSAGKPWSRSESF